MMPSLVRPGLSIQDVIAKRVKFRRVRIGQIFYANYYWWVKRSQRTALPADAPGGKPRHFKYDSMVRILDETMPTLAPVEPSLSYEEFMEQAAKQV